MYHRNNRKLKANIIPTAVSQMVLMRLFQPVVENHIDAFIKHWTAVYQQNAIVREQLKYCEQEIEQLRQEVAILHQSIVDLHNKVNEIRASEATIKNKFRQRIVQMDPSTRTNIHQIDEYIAVSDEIKVLERQRPVLSGLSSVMNWGNSRIRHEQRLWQLRGRRDQLLDRCVRELLSSTSYYSFACQEQDRISELNTQLRTVQVELAKTENELSNERDRLAELENRRNVLMREKNALEKRYCGLGHLGTP